MKECFYCPSGFCAQLRKRRLTRGPKLYRSGKRTKETEKGPEPVTDSLPLRGHRLWQDGAGTPISVGPQIHLPLLWGAALGGWGAAPVGTGQAKPPGGGDWRPAPTEKRKTTPRDFGIGGAGGYMADPGQPKPSPGLAHAPAYQERFCCGFRRWPADGPGRDHRLSGRPRRRLHRGRYSVFAEYRRGQRLRPPPCSPADERGAITRPGAANGNTGGVRVLSGKRGAGALGQRPAGIFNAGQCGGRVYAGAGGDDLRQPPCHCPAGAGGWSREFHHPGGRHIPLTPGADRRAAEPGAEAIWPGACQGLQI